MTNTSSNILIKEEHPNGIMKLILNDCDNKNALSENMLTSLVDAIKDISNQQDIKVIIIASTGMFLAQVIILKKYLLQEMIMIKENPIL